MRNQTIKKVDGFVTIGDRIMKSPITVNFTTTHNGEVLCFEYADMVDMNVDYKFIEDIVNKTRLQKKKEEGKKLIDAEELYRKFCELEDMAKKRVINTTPTSSDYERYVTELKQIMKLKHIVCDMPTVILQEPGGEKQCK